MKSSISLRLLSLMLVIVMLVSFTGCGSRSSSSEAEVSEPTSSSQSSEEEEEEEEVLRIFQIEKIDKGKERNPDTKGWLQIPNTEIDDAVLQASDNNYYLRITEDKEYSIFGCYFADFRNNLGSRSDLSRNTVIYGHSDYRDDPKGKKFSQLFNYAQDIDFVRNNPYIYFSTEEDDMVWQVFAVFFTHIDFNYIQTDPTDEQFMAMIKEAKEKSEYIIDIDVTAEDKILTLSTCTGLYNSPRDNYRMAVMAKLLPKNEIPLSKLTMEVEPNPNPVKS